MDYMQDIITFLGENTSTIVLAITAIILCLAIQQISHFVKFCIRIRKISAVVDKLPGEEGHWFWGHVFHDPGPCEEGITWGLNLVKKFPKYERFYEGWWRPSVCLRHPDSIKLLLKTTAPKAMSRGGGYHLIQPWLGDGLLISSGPKWFRNRKLLTPGFHFDVLKPYMEIYHDAASVLISKSDAASQSGNSVEIFDPVSLCTLDVMLRCAFSFHSDIHYEGSKYVSAVNSIADLCVDRAHKPWMYFDTLYYLSPNGKHFKELCDYVHGFADGVINTRKTSIKENTTTKKKYIDFLDILLLAKDETGEGLTHEEIRNEVDTFLFEGHETTASAVSWILYCLAKHPEVQRKCQAEVDGVIENTQKPYISWEDLHKLPFLTQCIKEGLRLYSPVHNVFRELQTPMEMDGLTLLSGTVVKVNIFQLHHNHLVWGSDHEEFRPERFTPENMEGMDSYAFLPFSAGPRNCIGQSFAMHELKVIVAHILQHFSLAVDSDHPIERMPLITMRAKDGIKLIFKQRKL